MNTIAAKSVLLVVCFLNVAFARSQSSQQIENAASFTKLYGYVKYFHPSDEAANVDWNRMAFFGSKQVSSCKTTEELQNVLTRLFKPIAPTLQIFPERNNVTFNKSAVMIPDTSGYQTIAWQHAGVGFGSKESIYKSARTNRPSVADLSASFAPVSSFLNAVPLQGKQFIYKCRMRLVKGNGKAQLWARVDKINKKMGFFYNMDDRPVRSNAWTEYEIKGEVDADAANLYFGVMLIGDGELEFDDMKVQVKEGDQWKESYSNSFSDEEKGKTPKGLYFNNNLPDYSIVIQNDQTGKESFVSIKSKDIQKVIATNTSLFKQYPEVGEYLEKSIGSGLKVILPLALYGTSTKTFPAADTGALSRLKETLANMPTTEMNGDNLFMRLGDIAISWNVFEHFYPYFEVSKTDWNGALTDAIMQAYSDKNALEFQTTLRQLTAKLKDGHVRVNMAGSKGVFMPLIDWEWIEKELVITYVGDSTLALKTGDIVKQIDDRPAKDYFLNVYRGISAATKGWLEYRAQSESLQGEKGSVMKLKIIRNNDAPADVSIIRSANQMSYYFSLPQGDTIKTLPNETMYVNFSVASMDVIKKALPELQKSRVIICDLRGYPNSNHEFIQYLLTKNDTSMQWMQIPQIIYPDHERIAGWKKMGWGLKPSPVHLDAKIIFLTDGRAISYAESFMGFIENYKLATIIGQPTAGTNGNINPFSLPGGYYISWTGMKVQKHDGTTHHGVGILPNIYVERTIKGVREGRDEFLEKAMEVGKKAL